MKQRTLPPTACTAECIHDTNLPVREALELADSIAFSLAIRHEIVPAEPEHRFISALRRKHSDAIPWPDLALSRPALGADRWLIQVQTEHRSGLRMPAGSVATRIGMSAAGDHFAVLSAHAIACLPELFQARVAALSLERRDSELDLIAIGRMMQEEERLAATLLDPNLSGLLLMARQQILQGVAPGHILLLSASAIAFAARAIGIVGDHEFSHFFSGQTNVLDAALERSNLAVDQREMLHSARDTVSLGTPIRA